MKKIIHTVFSIKLLFLTDTVEGGRDGEYSENFSCSRYPALIALSNSRARNTVWGDV